jgi:glycosyltransferase involved in cell wall biosynthesis
MTTPVAAAPRVSVIIPVHNGKDYIHEALRSVLDQSFGDLEIVLVDDGSSDFDYTSLETMDPRLRVIRLAGRGVSFARNAGLASARGQLLAFLDADDVWCPGKLAAQVNYFERHPQVGMVYGRYRRWNADPSGLFPAAQTLTTDCHAVERSESDRSGWLYARLLDGLLVGMNTAVVRRSVYDQIGGFRDDMRLGEDHDFWIRTSRVAEMHSLDAIVALYRIHGDSATQKRLPAENVHATLLNMARARWGLTGPSASGISSIAFRRRMAALHFSHGYVHYWRGDARIARAEFWRSVTMGHRWLRALAYVLLSQFKLLTRR